MARVTGPLLSFGALGDFGETLIFDRYLGQNIVRSKVIGRDPKTVPQQNSRSAFTTLSELWKLSGPLLTTFWEAHSKGADFNARNAFLSASLKGIRGEMNLNNFRAVVGSLGGLQVVGMTITPLSRSLRIALTAHPDMPGPVGRRPTALAIQDQTPAGQVPPYVRTEQRNLPFQSVLITDLEPVLHQVRGWYQILNPPTGTVWSREFRATATPDP